jgi:uncharacterized protein DUF262
MSINAQNRSLPDWFTRVRTHQTVLPRFQRFEAWSHGNVIQLFNTILQGLPVGAVLVLEIGNDEPFISRTIVGAPETGERVTEHLLDGQQRLTALWRGLHNNYQDKTYFLYLKQDEETGAPYFVDAIARWKKDGDTEMRPFWANKPKEQWDRKMIPLDLCATGEEVQHRFRDWAKQAIEDRDERDSVVDKIANIRAKFAAFNLPYLSLPATTKKETALDVFIKMNTSAASLSTYDVVVAQIEAQMGKSLHDLVAEMRETCPTVADYYSPEDLSLYVAALLQGRPPQNETYLSKDFGRQLLESWDLLVKGVSRAVVFLEEERIFDSARLPTDVAVPILAALWALAPNGLDAEGRARMLLRKYLWRAFFSNRYEKSTNTRSLSDFNDLKPLVVGGEGSTPAIFDEAQHPLPEMQELIAAGWPTKKDRLSRAILALALKQGGLDLADGSTASRANLAKREYHHLFPDAYLRKLRISDDLIYKSLNCALVTWRTNRHISDKEPERYLAERREGTSLGEAEISTRLASHLIPYREMVSSFLTQ